MSIFISLSHYILRATLLIYFTSGVYHTSEYILLKIEDSDPLDDLDAQKLGYVISKLLLFNQVIVSS